MGRFPLISASENRCRPTPTGLTKSTPLRKSGKTTLEIGNSTSKARKSTSRQNENISRTRTRAFLNFITFSLHCLRKTS